MKTIRALVVDDEPWARRRIVALLARQPDFEVVGEASDAAEAIARTEALAPDVVFLDVQMPDADGFDVVEALRPRGMPCIIFVTAHDQYAVRAFDAEAVDYLLKPFDPDRFEQAVARARRALERGSGGAAERRLDALLQNRTLKAARPTRLLVKTHGRILFLKASEVDWFEAAGNYVAAHVRQQQHLMRETMGALEARLDPDRFVRIHRSAIVNLDRVKELQPWFHGERVLVLTDGTQLTVGRTFLDRLQRLIENLA